MAYESVTNFQKKKQKQIQTEITTCSSGGKKGLIERKNQGSGGERYTSRKSTNNPRNINISRHKIKRPKIARKVKMARGQGKQRRKGRVQRIVGAETHVLLAGKHTCRSCVRVPLCVEKKQLCSCVWCKMHFEGDA